MIIHSELCFQASNHFCECSVFSKRWISRFGIKPIIWQSPWLQMQWSNLEYNILECWLWMCAACGWHKEARRTAGEALKVIETLWACWGQKKWWDVSLSFLTCYSSVFDQMFPIKQMFPLLTSEVWAMPGKITSLLFDLFDLNEKKTKNHAAR